MGRIGFEGLSLFAGDERTSSPGTPPLRPACRADLTPAIPAASVDRDRMADDDKSAMPRNMTAWRGRKSCSVRMPETSSQPSPVSNPLITACSSSGCEGRYLMWISIHSFEHAPHPRLHRNNRRVIWVVCDLFRLRLHERIGAMRRAVFLAGERQMVVCCGGGAMTSGRPF